MDILPSLRVPGLGFTDLNEVVKAFVDPNNRVSSNRRALGQRGAHDRLGAVRQSIVYGGEAVGRLSLIFCGLLTELWI